MRWLEIFLAGKVGAVAMGKPFNDLHLATMKQACKQRKVTQPTMRDDTIGFFTLHAAD